MSLKHILYKFLCLCIFVKTGSWAPNNSITYKNSIAEPQMRNFKSVKKKTLPKKPEWLKEWTISKGWVHNRSHLLDLGTSNDQTEDILIIQDKNTTIQNWNEINGTSYCSNAHLEDDDLGSINKFNCNRTEKIDTITNIYDIKHHNNEKMTEIVEDVSQNYRVNFPETTYKYSSDFQLSEIYKERLLMNRPKRRILDAFWRLIKTKSKKRINRNNKFTINELYDHRFNKEYTQIQRKDSTIGRDIAITNTLNSRANLHEDIIYECSEHSDRTSANNSPNYIYHNPLYNSYPSITKCIDFHSNHKKLFNQHKIIRKYARYKAKDEKYIMRHIKVRIMLTLRIGRIQKIKNGLYKYMFFDKGRPWNPSWTENNYAQNSKWKMYNQTYTIRSNRFRKPNLFTCIQEKNQVKLRLQQVRAMPSIETLQKHHADVPSTTNTTLALHYAAARGCLDCVRLLVDTSSDLSANTQMDNDVTPVYLAAQEGHLEVLKFLVLEAGGSLYVRAKDGMAPIHAASQMGCLNCVKWMVQDQGVDPNLRDGDGATPLHFASSRGHLDTVKWLLKHGARLSLDKYGKSPINDAAENQQVECLNVLVQHGTIPDYKDNDKSSIHSCSCSRKENRIKRGDSDCSSCKLPKPSPLANSEPFYLHPPLESRSLEAPHAPENGLYINPMNSHRHSTSSSSESGGSINGESFYLHNPEEVIYNRVKDLFDLTTNQRATGLSGLTVKVEVHSSSSGAGSDENLSSSDLSERSGDHDHDYEDIYLVREENSRKNAVEKNMNIHNQNINNNNTNNGNNRSRSRDSGSHSRSGSASSTNSSCNVVVKFTQTNTTDKNGSYKSNEFLPKPQKYEKYDRKKDYNQERPLSTSPSMLSSEDEPEKTKLSISHSVPLKNSLANSQNNARLLKRVTSVPNSINPPPPPPPPPISTIPGNGDQDEPRGAEIVEVVEEPTLRPSEIVKGMCRSMSALTSKRLNSSCSDLTIISIDTSIEGSDKHSPNLVNKQRVLPFIPPNFKGKSDSNSLIKPSEYLRSISADRSSSVRTHSESEINNNMVCNGTDNKVLNIVNGPPPPPLPGNLQTSNGDLNQIDCNQKLATPEVASDTVKKQMQPLSAISIQDLNSVQLRKTTGQEKLLTKTLSAPTRSMSLQCLQSAMEPFIAQKTDLIAELKMSRDIPGIKKMKIERAKTEVNKEKEMYSEISKQFTTTNFVEKIPDKDNSGNIIPAWKRQMLAKKAAEKARKELEEQMQKEAEEKRLQAIPQWKRQLIAKKEETELKIRSTIYTPKIVDDNKSNKLFEESNKFNNNQVESINNDNNNNEIIESEEKIEDNEHSEEEETAPIIPWRAQLRKTNSKLNLLE